MLAVPSLDAVPTARSRFTSGALSAVLLVGPLAVAAFVSFGSAFAFEGATVFAGWLSLLLWNLSGLSINGLIITGDVVRFTGVSPRNPFSVAHYRSVLFTARRGHVVAGLPRMALYGVASSVLFMVGVSLTLLIGS